MARPARLDRLCAEAVDLARAAAEESGEGVGEHLNAVPEAERVVTHFFDNTLAGYRGWRWAVVVARAPRSRTVTVSETALLPGPEALRSPDWVPWAERLRAGDVGVGDLLPTEEDDVRLMPAYTYSDDDAVEDIAFELGVGRQRVMSREGRIDTAERWYDGDHGPRAEISVSAPNEARCGSCGFYLQLAGSLRQLFGVCGNMYATDDAQVVSSDHGCGAHSEVLNQGEPSEPRNVDTADTTYDDAAIDPMEAEDESVTETDSSTTDVEAEADTKDVPHAGSVTDEVSNEASRSTGAESEVAEVAAPEAPVSAEQTGTIEPTAATVVAAESESGSTAAAAAEVDEPVTPVEPETEFAEPVSKVSQPTAAEPLAVDKTSAATPDGLETGPTAEFAPSATAPGEQQPVVSSQSQSPSVDAPAADADSPEPVREDAATVAAHGQEGDNDVDSQPSARESADQPAGTEDEV